MSNTQYRKGVEHLPLYQINTSMPALVMVYNLLTPDNEDGLVLEKQIDFANPADRKWIGRITFWCLTNHHSIETIAMVDANGGSK